MHHRARRAAFGRLLRFQGAALVSDWISRLRQASFRGVPFGAIGDEDALGRRLSVHEYPGRDDRFIEDLGASTPRIQLRGFLLENSAVYGGGDVLDQRDRLKQAAATSGSGILVHPTRGPIVVNLANLSISEQWDEQLFFALQFEFLEAGSNGLISTVVDTVAAVLNAAGSAQDILAQLFGTDADGYAAGGLDPGDTGSVGSLLSSSAQTLGSGVAGVFTLSGSAAVAAASLGSATNSFLSASSGLGLVTGSGLATATAATGVIRSVTALSDPGTGMDNMGQLADAFGDDG